ncbi:GPI mannosyltransferase 4 [Diutina catenulata]
MDWRTTYYLSLGLRFYFAVANSYLHPDEHFQTLEVVAGRIMGYNHTETWEFTDRVRSLAVLYLVYGPLVWLNKWFQLTPLQLWYVVRLVQMVGSMLVVDFCVWRMLPSKPERIKALVFIGTSYVTLVYQSHLFTNCLEVVLVVVAVYIVDDLRSELADPKATAKVQRFSALAAIFVFGVFTRITFAAFFVGPAWFIARYAWRFKVAAVAAVATAMATTAFLVALDSYLYSGATVFAEAREHGWDVLSIAPLASLKYNSSTENLAKHGLHPYWTHFLVNLPQLLGPGLAFLWGPAYKLTVPFLSLLSGICFLSVVPHQEARFLVAVVPLACCCFDLKVWGARFSPWVIRAWYAFNLAMAVLMGLFHQGGVVPALDQLRAQPVQPQMWWRTYSPPTWMLADSKGAFQFTTASEWSKTSSVDAKAAVVDCMGMDPEEMAILISDYTGLVVMPKASLPAIEAVSNRTFKEVWFYRYHYDMDHLDVNDLQTFIPGLAIYQII